MTAQKQPESVDADEHLCVLMQRYKGYTQRLRATPRGSQEHAELQAIERELSRQIRIHVARARAAAC